MSEELLREYADDVDNIYTLSPLTCVLVTIRVAPATARIVVIPAE